MSPWTGSLAPQSIQVPGRQCQQPGPPPLHPQHLLGQLSVAASLCPHIGRPAYHHSPAHYRKEDVSRPSASGSGNTAIPDCAENQRGPEKELPQNLHPNRGVHNSSMNFDETRLNDPVIPRVGEHVLCRGREPERQGHSGAVRGRLSLQYSCCMPRPSSGSCCLSFLRSRPSHSTLTLPQPRLSGSLLQCIVGDRVLLAEGEATLNSALQGALSVRAGPSDSLTEQKANRPRGEGRAGSLRPLGSASEIYHRGHAPGGGGIQGVCPAPVSTAVEDYGKSTRAL
ncbi:hypothetical protein SKAU_G00084780 [Synaphobranchus kaupii]|uniref:Uncharacterized protein n=1 Tax=Synaphobranchus kaupii TaxID=118154 RepID=A0A9Q1FVI9_SYNKA|nr:hypothetical protein SKAU_G00084780 [Synaphobranchus kaupii]